MQHATMSVLLVFALAASSCQSVDRAASRTFDTDVVTIAGYLTGTFDSRSQAAADPDNFFEIRLVTIPIWIDRHDGQWLYVEQAAFAALDQPYRQRVYHVHRDEQGLLRSDVYTLPGDPSEHVACWSNTSPLAALSPADLEIREGCSIILEPSDSGSFSGNTVGDGCTSSLRGASYATSEVLLTEGLITSWDRGWDANDEQVWGATKSGYRFVRTDLGPPLP